MNAAALPALFALTLPALGQTAFSLDRGVYQPGDDIVASWTNGPGSPTDWIGIYPRGVVPDGSPPSTLWLYVNGTRNATAGIAAGSVTFASASLPEGSWSAHFLANDGYTPITGKIDFEVVAGAAIRNFAPDHQFLDDGLPVTLRWTIAGDQPPVTSLTLDDGGAAPIDVFGQSAFEVHPSVTTEYTLTLNGTETLSTTVFRDAGNTEAFSLLPLSAGRGEFVTAQWSGATGNPDSWVGVYRIGDRPGDNPATAWNFLNGTKTAGGHVPDGAIAFELADGSYFAALFLDGGHAIEQGPVRFTVGGGSPAPRFLVDPLRRIHAVAGEASAGTLAAYARSSLHGGLTFAKVEGPAWLAIAADGSLTGTPGAGDLGRNRFTVRATDAGAAVATATLEIDVFAPGAVHVPTLKVLSFNIWVGTANVSDGYRKGLDSILLSDADLVAVSENNGRAGEWAADLGWHVFESGGDNAILSRYPITGAFTASHAIGTRVQLAASPPREVVIWGCHLTPYPYGPYEARDEPGSSAAKVAAALAAESASGRLAQIDDILASAAPQLAAAATTPVLLLGDFNCPSHLDWTAATAAAGLHFGLEIAWPVTRRTQNAGMIDAYRHVHPDPVTTPGDTWTPLDPADVQDRIDMVHFRGAPLEVTACEVFTTMAQGRWPSDHAGVLATFAVAPVDADRDGLADAWEVAHFGDLLSQDAGGDPDRDRHSNLAEWGFGTDPLAPDDPPPLRFERDPDGLRIAYRRIAGGTADGMSYTADGLRYTIETSLDLHDWAPAGSRAVLLHTGDRGNWIEEAVLRLTPPTGAPVPQREFVRIHLESVAP